MSDNKDLDLLALKIQSLALEIAEKHGTAAMVKTLGELYEYMSHPTILFVISQSKHDNKRLEEVL